MKDEDRLEEDLAALVRDGSRIPPMSPERVRLARERLAASVLGGGGGGGGGGDGEKAPPGNAPVAPPSGMLTLSAVKLGGIVALAFAAGVGVGVGARPAQPSATSAPSVAVTISPSLSVTPALEHDAALVPPTRVPSEEPTTQRPVQVAEAAAPPHSSPATNEGMAAERMLLDQARRALREGDGERALTLISRHETDHPKGALKEEREVVRIGALVSLGRPEDARTRLEAFRRQYPASPFLPALESQIAPR